MMNEQCSLTSTSGATTVSNFMTFHLVLKDWWKKELHHGSFAGTHSNMNQWLDDSWKRFFFVCFFLSEDIIIKVIGSWIVYFIISKIILASIKKCPNINTITYSGKILWKLSEYFLRKQKYFSVSEWQQLKLCQMTVMAISGERYRLPKELYKYKISYSVHLVIYTVHQNTHTPTLV